MARGGYKHVARGSGSPLTKARVRRDRAQAAVDVLAGRVSGIERDIAALTKTLGEQRARLLSAIEVCEAEKNVVAAIERDGARRPAKASPEPADRSHLESEPLHLLIRRGSIVRAMMKAGAADWLTHASPEFQRAYRRRVLGEVAP